MQLDNFSVDVYGENIGMNSCNCGSLFAEYMTTLER